MGDRLKPEDKEPPSKKTIDAIHRRVTHRWPGAHVEVIYAWDRGSTRLYFRWPVTKGTHGQHERVSTLRPSDKRVICFMSYRQLVQEVATLACATCDGEGVVQCSYCKGSGKTKRGRVCARCDGKAVRVCSACTRRIK